MTRTVEQTVRPECARSVGGSVFAGFDGAGGVTGRNAATSALVVREATVDDCGAIAHVYLETARSQYATIVAERVLERLPATHVARRWELLLSTRNRVQSAYLAVTGQSHVVGFAAGGPARSVCPGPAGELYAIYVLPQWQGLGLGHTLFRRAMESLASSGLDAIVTWVIAANPARRFFESLGGTVVASSSSRSGLTKVAYVWGEWPDPWSPTPIRETSTRHT